MKVTDKQLIQAVKRYREHPMVQDRHGPRSLVELGYFIAHIFPDTGEPLGRATLSLRLARLVSEGKLATNGDMPWTDGDDERLFTPALHVTEAGFAFIQGDNGNG